MGFSTESPDQKNSGWGITTHRRTLHLKIVFQYIDMEKLCNVCGGSYASHAVTIKQEIKVFCKKNGKFDPLKLEKPAGTSNNFFLI